MRQGSEFDEKNSAFIKKTFENGEYFKVGKEWFYEKYLSSYKSKSNLIFLIIFLVFFVSFLIFSTVASILKVSASNGVVSLESELGEEIMMQPLPKHYSNNEKNILRFVAEHYIEYFESYDNDKLTIFKLDEKINEIKKHSTKSVGEKFEKIARNNYTSEIFNGFTRKASITSFEFIEEENGFFDKFMRFILPENTPPKIRVSLTSTLYKNSGQTIEKQEKRVIELNFKYVPLERNANGEFGDLGFMVTSYNYLSV
jgi:type IV secretory pathway component VirB8